MVIDGGLHGQNGGYEEFAPNPADDDAGWIPREATYLVRNAGCQPVVMGPCPTWRIVGRLDAVSSPAPLPTTSLLPSAEPSGTFQPSTAPPTPPSAPTPAPSPSGSVTAVPDALGSFWGWAPDSKHFIAKTPGGFGIFGLDGMQITPIPETEGTWVSSNSVAALGSGPIDLYDPSGAKTGEIPGDHQGVLAAADRGVFAAIESASGQNGHWNDVPSVGRHIVVQRPRWRAAQLVT